MPRTRQIGKRIKSLPAGLRICVEPIYFDGRMIKTAICDRGNLAPGQQFRGPAIITEYSATTVIPPGKYFWLDKAENLVISIR